MSNSCFITPYDPKAWEDPDDKREKPKSDLKIWREIFRTALIDRWTSAEVQEDYFGGWILTKGKATPQGISDEVRILLHDDHQVVSFNNHLSPLTLEFILWYREFVPERYPLYFFDSTSWDRLLLTTKTSAADIAAFFNRWDDLANKNRNCW